MERLRQKQQEEEWVAAAEDDDNFFPDENGNGVFADLIRAQKVGKNKKLRIIGGPFVFENHVWYFRATPNSESWYFYKAIPHDQFNPIFLTEPYTQTDGERVREKFPEVAMSDSTTDKVPQISDYQRYVLPAIRKALEE